MDSPVHFFDLDPFSLESLLKSWSLPRFRAKQLLQWVYEKGVVDPSLMTNISQRDRDLIAKNIRFTTFRVAQHQVATDGTQKLLLEMSSDQSTAAPLSSTECVMIPSESEAGKARRTGCISSQVGCPVGCRFCASGLGGLEKNLTTGQIVEQVWWLQQLGDAGRATETEAAEPCRVTNIVFMGMGEPLSNFENVVRAIKTLHAPWAFHISGRKITVSTVGLPAQIRRLADLDLPLTLAISLHAPNDELRQELIPWAQYTSIDQLIEAGQHYFESTGREVTLEYILLRDINDRPEHAAQLARVAKRLRSNINLIRYNEVRSLPYNRPTTDDVHRFQQILREKNVNAHIRASRGRDIAAACGQLRHEAKTA